ncbi:hypothetical protein ATO13_23331 [Stappia sp. 22II-S9-Z10]|nr:hypothetical protein ATO13_23331 [Stappia sp. 22II-S9-Z10]
MSNQDVKDALTVCEMIKLLSAFDPETKVVVDGYESGFDPAKRPKPINVRVPTEAPDWWEGRFDDERDGEGELLRVVLIAR